jgi:quercetin dioxygenase-like cupin family protein
MFVTLSLSPAAFAGEPRTDNDPIASGRRQATTAAPQEGDKTPIMVSFTELKWTELPERKGMQFAVISGDPKTGAYTQVRKVLAGTDNPLHAHSSEITNVIISGVWYTGADAASARDFGPGSIVMMPANWTHVSGCRRGSDCVFYQEGKGKFDFKPVEGKASDAKPSK